MKSSPSDFGKNLIPFVIRYKFWILLTGVVVYIVFWPKYSKNQPAHNDSPTANKSSAVRLFDPAAEGANPKWSLPAELRPEKLQTFAAQVEKLIKDRQEVERLERLRSELKGDIINPKVQGLLWPAIQGKGFKDQKLAHDWAELSNGRFIVVDGVPTDGEVLGGNLQELAIDIAVRFDAIQQHIIGGKVLAGDVLCVETVQKETDRHLAYISKIVPQLRNLLNRLYKEFPKSLEPVMENLGRQFPNEYTAPAPMLGYSSDLNELAKDFNPSGYKMLILGSALQDLPIDYEITGENPAAEIKKVEFASNAFQWLGNRKITSFSTEFYKDKLYRIRIEFENEYSGMIFPMLKQRFGEFQNDPATWMRGPDKLKAKSPTYPKGKIFPVILASSIGASADDNVTRWDEINLFDVELLKEVQKLPNGPNTRSSK